MLSYLTYHFGGSAEKEVPMHIGTQIVAVFRRHMGKVLRAGIQQTKMEADSCHRSRVRTNYNCKNPKNELYF